MSNGSRDSGDFEGKREFDSWRWCQLSYHSLTNGKGVRVSGGMEMDPLCHSLPHRGRRGRRIDSLPPVSVREHNEWKESSRFNTTVAAQLSMLSARTTVIQPIAVQSIILYHAFRSNVTAP